VSEDGERKEREKPVFCKLWEEKILKMINFLLYDCKEGERERQRERDRDRERERERELRNQSNHGSYGRGASDGSDDSNPVRAERAVEVS
jgi:hypothetical protein